MRRCNAFHSTRSSLWVLFPPPLSVNGPRGDNGDGDDPSPSLGGTVDGGGVGGAVPLLGSKRELSPSGLLGSATGGAENAAWDAATVLGVRD